MFQFKSGIIKSEQTEEILKKDMPESIIPNLIPLKNDF